MEKLRLLRYSGAKTEFVDKINYVLNKWKASTYVEAFLGSGVVFLNLTNNSFKKFYINDIDRNVIHIFKTFKDISYSFFKKHYNYIIQRFGNIEQSKEAFNNFKDWFNQKVWKSDTQAEGVFLMILSLTCINSLFFFTKKGFGSGYGNRDYAKNYDEFMHHHIKKRLNNNNTIITNLDFFDFLDFLKSEEKDNKDITMFVDPPYALSTGKVSYNKHFPLEKHQKFIDFIENSEYNIAYTDTKNNLFNWDFLQLRETMVNTSPTSNKFENGLMEVLYFNK